jgi:hypothetical protein
MMELPQVEPPPTSGEKLMQPTLQPLVPGGSQISPGSITSLPHTMLEVQMLGSASHS